MHETDFIKFSQLLEIENIVFWKKIVCDIFQAFEMYLTERFWSEHILFIPGSAEFPQAIIPYSMCDLKSEL